MHVCGRMRESVRGNMHASVRMRTITRKVNKLDDECWSIGSWNVELKK